MKVKRLRYNLLMFGLIALIGCYVGMNFFAQDSAPMVNDGNADSSISTPGDENLDVVEDPSMNEPAQQGVKIPTNDKKLVLYALDILNSGAGYSAKFQTTVTNQSTGITVQQYVKGDVLVGVNSLGEKVSLETNFYKAGDDTPDLAKNQVYNNFKGFYINNAKNSVHAVITEAYSYDAKTYDVSKASTNENLTIAEAQNKYKILQGLGFPIKLKDGNFAISETGMATGEKNTKVIKVRLPKCTASVLGENFVNYYSSTGQMSGLEYTSIVITFKINTQNGYIKEIVREEKFSATAMGLQVKSEVSTTMKFSSMNKAAVLGEDL